MSCIFFLEEGPSEGSPGSIFINETKSFYIIIFFAESKRQECPQAETKSSLQGPSFQLETTGET
jgi:hypothetical protein